jgi:BirA family biotin operon repressor/biotin-[acetyl-CoA-carboxylase] ligase
VRTRLHRLGVVDSTSERAFAALGSGAAEHGDLFTARGQTAGRGRRGRGWESAEGEGLYASLVLLPGPPPLPPTLLTMAAGLAVLDACRETGAEGLRLDWPNDVVHGEAKLAGILVESRGLDPAAPHYVVGVGVNVLQERFGGDLEAERSVTSLARLGVRTDPDALLEALQGALGPRLEAVRAAPGELADAYLAATGLAGREVTVVSGAGDLERGTLEALRPGEGLVLRPSGGEVRILPLEHVRALDPAPGTRPGASPPV